ncbi:MAG TPA: hypothetical protein VMU38_02830 [Candidatus Binatia bacterium]|nr:hypothetical protein [Candidatus Binatia bacterium]
MKNVTEVQRRPSPGGRPQPLAVYEDRLWVGAWETDHIYAIDTKAWSFEKSVPAPGKPYGIARFGSGLMTVVSLGEDDDRYFYRYDSAGGFDPSSKVACPDFTGSHLAADGSTLYLCQQGKRQILTLDANLAIARTIALPTRCGGFAFGPGGDCYMITADAEFENLEFARFDLRAAEPKPEPIAAVPFDARGLTFDGTAWWTCHREENQIVAFTV